MTTQERRQSDARDKSLAIWEEMSAAWRRHNDFLWETGRSAGEWIVAKTNPQPGDVVLDVAAGPGDTGLVAAQLIGAEGKLISTDFSESMVDIARDRAAALGVTNAEFKVMDAEKMDLPDQSVDVIVCRWGFMLMLDPSAALKECYRVLRPGGRLAFSVWGGPEHNAWVTVYGMVMTQQGYPPQGDPFGPGGMFSMAQEQTVRSMLAEAGFDDIEVQDIEVHWRFKDFEESWAFATEVAGAIAALVKTLEPEQVEDLRTAIIPAVAPYKDDEGYDFPGLTLNAAATKA